MKLFNPILCVLFITVFTLFTSCREVVVEYDCGVVETEMAELNASVGKYIDSIFTNDISTNFEEAAIAIYVDGTTIITETETSCFSFTADPQLIEKVKITSSESVTTGGLTFAADTDLIELFEVHTIEGLFSISEFIMKQNDLPQIFHIEGDKLILQLLNKPDVAIDQSFIFELTFDDAKTLDIEIPSFIVSN
ncbi:hypothetical protein N9B82_04130 [Saprospiraceae bacterium]|nr:hypothetical protein [Saprospiraceae bacterium]